MKKGKIKLYVGVLALLLIVVWAVFPLFEMIGQPDGTEPQSESTPNTLEAKPMFTDPTKPEPVVTRQLVPETVDNPNNLPVLKWVCLTDMYGGVLRTWTEEGFHNINKMLEERNLPFRLQFVMYTFDYAITDNGVFFDRPEVQEDLQTADLIYGFMSGEDAKNLLTPITDYVTGKGQPSLKNAVPHEVYWHFTTLDGEIYGVPTMKSYPTGLGWTVSKAFLEDMGLTTADFQKDYWEMDEVFSKIDELYSGPFLYGTTDSFSTYTSYTSGVTVKDYSPGVISAALRQRFARCGGVFGIEAGTQKVVNVLNTEFARNMQQALGRYKKASYIVTKGQAKVQFGDVYGGVEGYRADGLVCVIPVYPATYNANEQENPKRMNGIAKNSRYMQEGLTLLQLLGEDEEFLKQFAFGQEGADYKLDENGNYSLIKNDTGADYSLSHLAVMSGFCGIRSSDSSTKNPGVDYSKDLYIEGKSYLEAHREVWNQAEEYNVIPIDYSEFEREMAEIETVCKLYFSSFSMMSTEKYDEMLAAFKKAGADEVIRYIQYEYNQQK